MVRESAISNLDNYKMMYGYVPPFPTICEAEFVKYVQDANKGQTVSQVLKDLLGAEVHIFSTLCISLAIRGLYGEPGHHRHAEIKGCEHSYANPDFGGLTCFKLFARSYPSHRLVVCTMRDAKHHAKYPGRLVVTPDADLRGSIIISSAANSYATMQPPPEISIMDDYRRIFGYKPPFRTICEPRFIQYLEGMGKNLSSELEDLLGGKVELISTPCINQAIWGNRGWYPDVTTIIQCEHAGQDIHVNGARCMKDFVERYPGHELVVCTMTARDHYASVVGIVVVTPDDRGGILIGTVPSEALVQHAKEKLREIRSSAVEPSTAIGAKNMVDNKPAKVKKSEYDIRDVSLSCVVEKPDEIPFPTPNKKGKRKREIEESNKSAKVKKPVVDVSASCVVEKPDEIPFPTPNKKGKRKREIEESNKSAKVKKPMVDVSARRPEIDMVERIGVGVTAEAQSLFDALSKTFTVRWDKTVIVVMNEVRVSSPYLPENVSGGTHEVNEHLRKEIQHEIRRLQTRGAGQ